MVTNFLFQIDFSLDNDQLKIFFELINFSGWHCRLKSYQRDIPPYLIRPNVNPIIWWKYLKKAITMQMKKLNHKKKSEYLKKIKIRRNEYMYLYQVKLLNVKSKKKRKNISIKNYKFKTYRSDRVLSNQHRRDE